MKVYKEFMNSITAQNQALRHLTQQNTMQEPFKEQRRKSPDFEKARQHALSIFAVLQKTLTRSCSTGHRASLYMKPIQSKSDRRVDPEMLRLVFHHKIGSVTHTSGSRPPWTVEEAEIRLLNLSTSNEEILTQSLQRIRFELPTPRRSVREPASAKEIQDLCESLRTISAAQSGCDVCLGYLSDDTKDCRHELYRPEVPIVEKDSAIALSLRQLLDQQQGYKLGVSDKIELAFALASGVLRLDETPWLAKQWGKDEIIVFKRKGGIAASHPFVSTEVPESEQPRPISKQYFTSCRLIKEETIFALGVLLIEIALEKPFEELRKPEDLNADGTEHELSDFYTAEGTLDDVCLAAGDRYGEAVARCVQGNFDQKRKSTLEDPAFRKKVYDGVVAELKADLDDLNL